MSASAQFKNFVERQQRSASAAEAVDWKKEKDDWLAHLKQLYALITASLQEYIDDRTIELHKSSIELNEENIGAYSANRLTISIGTQQIVLTPIGTLLIGSKGRVDVEGSGGTSRLILIPRHIDDPRQMFRVTATAAPGGKRLARPETGEAQSSSDSIEWTWKIVSRPPTLRFIDLNKETLFEMLMEVSGG